MVVRPVYGGPWGLVYGFLGCVGYPSNLNALLPPSMAVVGAIQHELDLRYVSARVYEYILAAAKEVIASGCKTIVTILPIILRLSTHSFVYTLIFHRG